MCLFPLPNTNFKGVAYRKGVHYFDCGSCPECLRKRSNVWCLRSTYEAKKHVNNCMVTLTYDNFAYDDEGNIVGELPVNPDIIVDKTHIQKFIKRLRRWIDYHSVSGCDIDNKYIVCAEYGTRTHRAHYHCILFGVNFPDRHFYKKSKRGNILYMSPSLTRLWSYGICTIDSVRVHSAIARYCTKYLAKSRSDSTFMLFSQNIGFDDMVSDFNGLNYIIDGREYPVPRSVWNSVLMDKFKRFSSIVSPKYVNHNKKKVDGELFPDDSDYEKARADRKRFRYLRDRDNSYISYINYWSSKGRLYDSLKPSVRQRILALDDAKFHSYKVRALACLELRLQGIPVPAPNSGCVSAYLRYLDQVHWDIDGVRLWFSNPANTCRIPSRPNTASHTKKRPLCPFDNTSLKYYEYEIIYPGKLLTLRSEQCTMFSKEFCL